MLSGYRSQLRTIVTALALLWLSACTTPVMVRPQPPVVSPPAEVPTPAVPAARSQQNTIPQTRSVDEKSTATPAPTTSVQPITVAELLRQASITAPSQQRQLLLQAVAKLLQNRQFQEATALLSRIDTRQATAPQQAQKRLYLAQIALSRQRQKRAARLLHSITSLPGVPPDLLGQVYRLQSQLDKANGKLLAAAIALIRRSTTLADATQSRNNARQIWQLLRSVAITTLQQARLQTNSKLLDGWLDLSLAQLTAMEQSRDPLPALRDWQERYPDHPAARQLLYDIAPALAGPTESLPTPRKIALLLPLSSDFASAAKIMQNSILDARQSQYSNPSLQIAVYDIGDEPTLAGLYYQQAVQQGADWIIGPLGKAAAQALVTSTQITVPTLLLAVLPADIATPYNTFQIGLLPEQEAQRVAERAARDNLRSAVAFYPDTTWGRRMIQAWQQQWQQLGGKIASMTAYNPNISDYSRILKKTLGIHASELRMRRLQAILRTRLKFQPRRRQDIDHIVLFANAASGRLIKPQINFYQAINLPVYSSSAIYTGQPDKIRDADLNGIHFPDMPWILDQQGATTITRSTLAGQGQAVDRSSRLYALGIDAYQILSHLGYLRDHPNSVYTGVSASMRMDANRRLQRYPLWAIFRNGLAIADPDDNNLGNQTAAGDLSTRNSTQSGTANEIPSQQFPKPLNLDNTARPPSGADRWQPPAAPGTGNSPPQLPIPSG